MIEGLYVAVPKKVISREDYPNPQELAYFEKMTGIKKTRRFETVDTHKLIIDGIRAFDLKNRLGYIDGVIVVTQTPRRS